MTESHSICIPCWNRINPDELYGRNNLITYNRSQEDTCCFCLVQHRSGIYVRAHLSETVCRGHGEAVLTEPKVTALIKEPKVTASYDPSEYYLPTIEETPYEGLTHEQLVEEELGLALGLTHVIGSDPDDEENLDNALEDMI